MATEEKKEKPTPEKKGEAKEVKKERPASEKFIAFKKSLEEIKEPEEKISRSIAFMKEALSDGGSPALKDYWDAKHYCVPFFKEQMNPIKRNHLWAEYAELNQEAKRLKELIDEQTAFAVEQIDLAIVALEADFAKYDEQVKKAPHLDIPPNTKKLVSDIHVYETSQSELHVLKSFVGRLDALRKETINTGMRISVKNKFLKRLSKVGDHVFPKRKELIKTMSDQFSQDVKTFVSEKFTAKEGKKPVPFYVLRDDIKNFQSLAKLLTLNSQAFTATRKSLSECWDQIKEEEKKYRQESGEKSKEHKENEEALLKKVAEYEASCADESHLAKEKVLEGAATLQAEMKSTELSRDGVKNLREKIQKVRKEALAKIQDKADAQIKKDREKVEALKKEITDVIEKEQDLSFKALAETEEKLLKSYQAFNLSGAEKNVFERNFSDLRSFVLDKKGESTSELEELENLLSEREDHLNLIKKQVEDYRKEMGGSGLDFEKAMIYRELYDSAKIHLDREIEAVDQIEEKITKLES